MIVHEDGKLEGTPEELVEFLRLKEKTQSIFGLGTLDFAQKTELPKPPKVDPYFYDKIYCSTELPPKVTYDHKTGGNSHG